MQTIKIVSHEIDLKIFCGLMGAILCGFIGIIIGVMLGLIWGTGLGVIICGLVGTLGGWVMGRHEGLYLVLTFSLVRVIDEKHRPERF